MKNHQLPGDNRETAKNKGRKRDDRSLLGILSFFAITIILVLQYNHHRKIYAPFYASTSPFTDPEHANPGSYLIANGGYNPNNWADKQQIRGTITNNAHHTSYRDVHIRVRFLNPAKVIVSTQEFILNESVPYGTTKTFNLRIRTPLSAVACRWTAVGGAYY
ncbi:MAG: hypothetical protein Q8918_12190 [Bacteroidota bacterium]|nr:hypothetical protein [Bacteroidota bacterium]MDP4212769.1 hypothetical protein [Bacteroidota bacterium]MDP4250861.1 hypothetical protein [Bacteroidota bacterium]